MTKRTVTALVLFLILVTGCSGKVTATPAPTATSIPEKDLPRITSVTLDRVELPRYESLEMIVSLDAQYANPYDVRQVRLDGIFTGPSGKEMNVPGFWDGTESWRMRFTPSEAGAWTYRLTVSDGRGSSLPVEGTFTVTPSDLHGWLQVGKWVNPDYSGRYLIYQDGTPFYGVGHCDALNILIDGFTVDNGVGLFNNMKDAGENFVVWWPLYSNSPIGNNYDDYSASNMSLIDMVVKDAQAKGVFLIFTIWDHPELRDNTHSWGTGRWSSNGFNKLGDIDSFFTSPEAWAWQENFYRYIIARWGYSPAIGMWQTVSEINGTNAYEQTDPWHNKVNSYFVEHDPYRHPTTASKSGDTEWTAGHRAMDVPQVHIYDLKNRNQKVDVVHAAQYLADWTGSMWNQEEKPNWLGEFGAPGNVYYPELLHNAIWSALASGAALTPAEWNSGGSWGKMTPAMNADMKRLAQFVLDLPLAQWNPSALEITTSDSNVRGWGVAGKDGGLLWVQDFTMEGKPIEDVRAYQATKSGVEMEVRGLAAGTYTVTPYDTWQGIYLSTFDVTCAEGQACTISLPDFKADMAFKLERKP